MLGTKMSLQIMQDLYLKFTLFLLVSSSIFRHPYMESNIDLFSGFEKQVWEGVRFCYSQHADSRGCSDKFINIYKETNNYKYIFYLKKL